MAKVWFITGTSTGLGRVLAEEALAVGDSVVATARKPEVLSDLAERYPEQVLTAALDVQDESSIAPAVEAAIARFGRIDVLVNNAGYGHVGALEEFSDAEVQRQYDVNVFGQLRVLRAVLPVLRGQGSGHILNITSVAGFRSRPGFGLYCSTKFAFEAIGEALYHELAPLGIHVTNISPGVFRTDFAGRSHIRAEKEIDAYAETSHANIAWLDDIDGKQAGDPRKAARAMIESVSQPDPPLRLPLGKDAVAGILDKLDHVRGEVERSRAISESTDFDEVTA